MNEDPMIMNWDDVEQWLLDQARTHARLHRAPASRAIAFHEGRTSMVVETPELCGTDADAATDVLCRILPTLLPDQVLVMCHGRVPTGPDVRHRDPHPARADGRPRPGLAPTWCTRCRSASRRSTSRRSPSSPPSRGWAASARCSTQRRPTCRRLPLGHRATTSSTVAVPPDSPFADAAAAAQGAA